MQYQYGKFGSTKKNYMLWQFDSINELAEAAKANPKKRTSDKRGTDDFNSTDSFADAYELAVDGWHSIRDRVDGVLTPLREKLGDVLAPSVERAYDLVGSEPDINRYIQGELECMVEWVCVDEPKNGKVFTLLVDNSMTAGNKAEDIIARGAVLCALVESYILLGYQLEIWVESTWRGDGSDDYATVLTRLNHAGDIIDIDTMMFALGNGDWQRRIAWAFAETNDILAKKFGFNGSYCGLHRNGAHMIDRVGASSVVSLDGNKDMTSNPAEWVLGQLAEQGVWEDDR